MIEPHGAVGVVCARTAHERARDQHRADRSPPDRISTSRPASRWSPTSSTPQPARPFRALDVTHVESPQAGYGDDRSRETRGYAHSRSYGGSGAACLGFVRPRRLHGRGVCSGKAVQVIEVKQTMADHDILVQVQYEDQEHVGHLASNEDVLVGSARHGPRIRHLSCREVVPTEVLRGNSVEVRPEVEGWLLVRTDPGWSCTIVALNSSSVSLRIRSGCDAHNVKPRTGHNSPFHAE